MAGRTSNKVAVITGAAKDDIGVAGEENLVTTLDVLSNDPGAARLYSLWQNPSPLTTTDQFEVKLDAKTALGATIRIVDGALVYDGTGISGSLQHLGLGDSALDTFTYTVRMANGALSTATVAVTIAGANDKPVLQSVTPATVQDGANAADATSPSGQLVGSDIDDNETATLVYSLVGDGVTDWGTLSVTATGSWVFDANEAVVDAMGAGIDAGPLSFNVIATDENGLASDAVAIVINVKGANDLAEATDDSKEVTEDSGNYTVNGTVTVSDRDAGQSGFAAPLASDLIGAYGTFAFNAGAWSYTLYNALAQSLVLGDSETDTLTVWSIDGTTSSLITVTINGVDEPEEEEEQEENVPPDGGGNFMFTYGDYNNGQGHNFFTGFTAADTLRHANNLFSPVVTASDWSLAGGNWINTPDGVLDTTITFDYVVGHKAPVSAFAVLVGIVLTAPNLTSVAA